MKQIKAVEMVREIRDRIYEETKNLKGDALKRYYSEKSKWAFSGAKSVHPQVSHK
jgi:hypothetical protein